MSAHIPPFCCRQVTMAFPECGPPLSRDGFGRLKLDGNVDATSTHASSPSHGFADGSVLHDILGQARPALGGVHLSLFGVKDKSATVREDLQRSLAGKGRT